MSFYYLYQPEAYFTTYLDKTFPSHHLPFEKSRHKLGHFMKSIGEGWDDSLRKPQADVRETVDKYHIDVELPGLETKEHLKLKWTSARTLLIEAELTRPKIEGQEGESLQMEKGKEQEVEESLENTVHLTVKERYVGPAIRAFDFPVDVEREGLEAVLKFGLLRIVVPKMEHGKAKENHIEVKHAGL